MSLLDTPASEVDAATLARAIQEAGVAGAGGAGFPAYAKWERIDEIDYLLINHQESEPNFVKDRYLGREHAKELAELVEWLLDGFLDTVVIGTKESYRGVYLGALEERTGAVAVGPDELPIDPEQGGVIIAGTDDRYEYGMESVLLRLVADTVIGKDLPLDHGWIVQNTESMYNIYQALAHDQPVTRELVHVDGDTPRHRFLDVPVGTPGSTLLSKSGRPGGPGRGEVLADGGPGWSFEIGRDPGMFGVTKRTNCLLIIDRALVEGNTLGGGRINILGPEEWKGREFETEPVTVEPEYVRVPLIANESLDEWVARSVPTVTPGETVTKGQVIAEPPEDGFSNFQHASISGEVTVITENHVTIERE